MINFTKFGNGNPVVLVHGLAASQFDWIELIPELARADFCSYALDLPGHGKSDGLENNDAYSIDHIYSLFQNWIDDLQFEEPLTIIGHSLGGYLAIQYTLNHPEKVSALVLCDPLVSLDQLPFWMRIIYRYKIIDLNIIQHLPQRFIRAAIDITSLSIRNGFVLTDEVRQQTAQDYK